MCSSEITVIPWSLVQPGDVVLTGGEWATVRETWSSWERGVGLTLWVDGVGDRQPNPYHADKHAESLTAVRRSHAPAVEPPVVREVSFAEGLDVIRRMVLADLAGDEDAEMAPGDAQSAAGAI